MTAQVKLGYAAKLYRNAGTYAEPDWVEIDLVADLGQPHEKVEADATFRRQNGWRATKGTIREAPIEFGMLWDPTDAGFAAIAASYFGGNAVELLVLDGPIDELGSEGIRASYEVMQCERTEDLEGILMANVTAKPTYSANPPAVVAIEDVEGDPIAATESGSGYIESWHADWATARAGANLSLPQLNIRAYAYQPPYYIHRGFLQFDTLGLGIVRATLRMTLKDKGSAAGVQVARLASPYSNLIPGLFAAAESAEVESQFLADVDLDEEVDFLAGDITVNNGGMTCFNVREKPHDVDDHPPPVPGHNLVEFYDPVTGFPDKEPLLIPLIRQPVAAE